MSQPPRASSSEVVDCRGGAAGWGGARRAAERVARRWRWSQMIKVNPKSQRAEEMDMARDWRGMGDFHWPPLKRIWVVSSVEAEAGREFREEMTRLSGGVKLESMAARMPASWVELALMGMPPDFMKVMRSSLLGRRFCVTDFPVGSVKLKVGAN